MISAFEIGVSLNVALNGLQKIQQLAAEFTKVQQMADQVAAQMGRLGDTLNTTFARATASSNDFEASLERNLQTMRAMGLASQTVRNSTIAGGGREQRYGAAFGGITAGELRNAETLNRMEDARYRTAVRIAEYENDAFDRRLARERQQIETSRREQERSRAQFMSMSGIGAFIGMQAVERVWHAIVPLGTEITRMRLLGESPQSIARARESAFRTAQQVPGYDIAQAMEVNRKAFTLFGQIPQDLLRTLATNAKAIAMTTGEDSNTVLQAMFRGIEATQRLTKDGRFDPERVKREADLFASGTILAGGDIRAQQLMHTQVYSSAAQRFQKPEEGVAMAVTATEFFGPKAGNYLQQLNNTLESGKLALTKTGASIAFRAHLLDTTQVGFTPDVLSMLRGGKGSGIIPLAAQAISLDPHKGQMENLRFVAERLRQIMPSLGMQQTPENFQKLLNEVFRTDIARLMGQLLSESGQAAYQRNLTRLGEMPGGEERLKILRQDPAIQMQEFLASLRTLAQEVISLSQTLGIIQGITSGVHAINELVHAFPTLTHIITGIIGDLVLAWAMLRLLRLGQRGILPIMPIGATPSSPVSQATTLAAGTQAAAGGMLGGMVARGQGLATVAIGRGIRGFLVGEIAKTVATEAFGPDLPQAVSGAILGMQIGSLAGLPGAIAGAIAGAILPYAEKGIARAEEEFEKYKRSHPAKDVPPVDPISMGMFPSAIPYSWLGVKSAPPAQEPYFDEAERFRRERKAGIPYFPPAPAAAPPSPAVPRVIPHITPPLPGRSYRPSPLPLTHMPVPHAPAYSMPGAPAFNLPPPTPTPISPHAISPASLSPTGTPIGNELSAMTVTNLYVSNLIGPGARGGGGGATSGSGTGDSVARVPTRAGVGGRFGAGHVSPFNPPSDTVTNVPSRAGIGGRFGAGHVSPFSAPGATFAQKAPAYMARLMKDLNLPKFQAAAILGSLGHESMGFTKFHEMGKPANMGGIGAAMWTGTRRRDFEALLTANGLDPSSDAANLHMLEYELTHGESRALKALRQTTNLREATETFMGRGGDMTGFERPGVPALDRRLKYAQIAFDTPLPNAPLPGTELAAYSNLGLNTFNLNQPDPVMPPPSTNNYNAQVDIHLDDERIASHVFRNMFDNNPAGAAGPTGFDRTMSPWAAGTSGITR